MRILVAAAAALVMLGSASANAQSLEQTYANLCSDPAKAKSESCVALAQALVAKLQAHGVTPTNAGTTSAFEGPDAATHELWRKRWGDHLGMIGKDWFVAIVTANGLVEHRFRYFWNVPGEEYTASVVQPDGTLTPIATTRWDAEKQQIATGVGPSTAYAVAQPDGSVLSLEMNGYRGVSRRLGDGSIESVVERNLEGAWTVVHVSRNVEHTPERIALERERVQLVEQQKLLASAEQRRAERADQAARSAARGAMFGAVLQGLAQGVSESNTGGYAEAQSNLDATVANIQHAAAAERWAQAPAQQQAPARAVDYRAGVAERVTHPQPQPLPSATTAVGPAAPAAAKELRFVMSISLRNQPGDKVNPSCYSNIIRRPGPPGWGAPGFLPPGSAEQAREAVYSLKPAFIAQCRARGREITSDGNFNFQLNQLQGDEERLQGMRARYNEDVSVSL